MLRISRAIAVDEDEFEWSFVRSSGPGGQNVNKVATAAQLRFDAAGSESLPADVKRRALSLAGAQATANGEIVIDARRYRSQARNRDDALQRLAALLRRAAQRPKVRRKTKPTTASRQRRLDAKKRRSQVKSLRRRISDE